MALITTLKTTLDAWACMEMVMPETLIASAPGAAGEDERLSFICCDSGGANVKDCSWSGDCGRAAADKRCWIRLRGGLWECLRL